MIEPTVGRVVWFHSPTSDQPQAALVAYVHGSRLVNLLVVDKNGSPYQATSVQLLQEDDVPAAAGVPYAEWMPFQKGQSVRNEGLTSLIEQVAHQAGVLADRVAQLEKVYVTGKAGPSPGGVGTAPLD